MNIEIWDFKLFVQMIEHKMMQLISEAFARNYHKKSSIDKSSNINFVTIDTNQSNP